MDRQIPNFIFCTAQHLLILLLKNELKLGSDEFKQPSRVVIVSSEMHNKVAQTGWSLHIF